MSDLYPFPTNVFRVFPSSDIEVLKRDESGNPTTICLTTHNSGDRAIAQVLLEGSADSFVLSDHARYFADGTVVPCDPARPASITELHRAFDVETVEFTWPGPRPRVYIFTHTLQEWEDAKAAVRHLVAQKLLSLRSYIESDHTGEDQGLSAQNLDGTPHRAGLVALFREAAYCVQNDLYERDADTADWDDEDEDLDRDEDWDDEDEDLDRDDDWWDDDDEANDGSEGEDVLEEKAERHEEQENHRESRVVSTPPRQRITTRLTRPLGF